MAAYWPRTQWYLWPNDCHHGQRGLGDLVSSQTTNFGHGLKKFLLQPHLAPRQEYNLTLIQALAFSPGIIGPSAGFLIAQGVTKAEHLPVILVVEAIASFAVLALWAFMPRLPKVIGRG